MKLLIEPQKLFGILDHGLLANGTGLDRVLQFFIDAKREMSALVGDIGLPFITLSRNADITAHAATACYGIPDGLFERGTKKTFVYFLKGFPLQTAAAERIVEKKSGSGKLNQLPTPALVETAPVFLAIKPA